MTAKSQVQQLLAAIDLPGNLAFFDQSESIRAIESTWLPDLSILASHLYIKKQG